MENITRVPDDPRIIALGDDPQLIDCPECDGDGFLDVDGDRIPCPRCHTDGCILNPDLYDR